MEEPFILTVTYKAEEKDFKGWLLLQGFTHKIKVLIGETEVYFEPDDDGGYRAVMMPWQNQKELEKIDKLLLSLLSRKIQELVQ